MLNEQPLDVPELRLKVISFLFSPKVYCFIDLTRETESPPANGKPTNEPEINYALPFIKLKLLSLVLQEEMKKICVICLHPHKNNIIFI